MPNHGIDLVSIRRTPMSVLGTSTGFASAVIKQISDPYAILKNIIIRSKYDASARHPMVHASPYMESTVTA